ncbi:MAG: ribonuclease HI [Bacteroidota bacterium]
MKEVTIYTDGSCSGNPGPGGWAALLQYGSPPVEREISGHETETTNNRMELTAALAALEALKEPCRVRVYSDSSYLVNAFNDNWIGGWKRRGWKKSDKKPVLNRDLWERLDAQNRRHEITWTWVKGHAGHEENERVDQLAVAAREIARVELTG